MAVALILIVLVGKDEGQVFVPSPLFIEIFFSFSFPTHVASHQSFLSVERRLVRKFLFVCFERDEEGDLFSLGHTRSISNISVVIKSRKDSLMCDVYQ